MHLPYDSVISQLAIYPKQMETANTPPNRLEQKYSEQFYSQ